MFIIKSVVLLVLLTTCSLGLLFISATKLSPSFLKTAKYCEGFTKTTLFSPWNSMPQSLLFVKRELFFYFVTFS